MAYEEILSAFTEGLLVAFNNDTPGSKPTRELEVTHVNKKDDGTIEVNLHESGELAYRAVANDDSDDDMAVLYEIDEYGESHYDNIITIEILGYA